MDFQSVKTTEEGARSNGYDAHKNVKGRKRHLLMDTMGLPLSVYVTSADIQDRPGGTVSFGRAKAVRAPLEEDLGGWSIRGREAGRLV
jgi:putative transposase